MVLATALLLTVILFALGGTYLLSVHQDTLKAYRKTVQAQAYYLALSGLHYYIVKNPPLNSGPFTRAVPAKDANRFFTISLDPTGQVTSEGDVLNGAGRVIAKHILILPAKAKGLTEMYDADQ